MPLAPGYLLTWHTYATWLHGDAAGSVDLSNNSFGTPRLEPSAARLKRDLVRSVHPPLTLSPIARQLVNKVMCDHCALRTWDLRAIAIRSNHVHVVIANPTIAPETIVKQLKEWGTRKLCEHRIIEPKQRAWADHASTIYLYEPHALDRAVQYVQKEQDAPRDDHLRPDWREQLGL